MESDLDLDWPGLVNARELGGHPTTGPGPTARHRLVRSDDLANLTPSGWTTLEDHGIRTIIDLRGRDEGPDYRAAKPTCVTRISLPLYDPPTMEPCGMGGWGRRPDRWGRGGRPPGVGKARRCTRAGRFHLVPTSCAR